jgi:ACS family hexuronate transporter-like MFS transporter
LAGKVFGIFLTGAAQMLILIAASSLLFRPNWGNPLAVLALVLAAHQGFSTSLFALITDVAPKAKIGRMTSFGVFSGNIGGMLILKVAGMVLAAGLGYLPLFLFASVSYLLALAWIHLMLPTIRLVDASERGEAPLRH